MKLFLDTADISQIREAVSWGIVDGVTTNPSHISKTGRSFEDVSVEILELVDGPVNLETVSLTCSEIVIEGKRLAALHPNVVVKVPLIKEGLKAVKQLSAEGVKTNVTVTFSPLQALLAAKCGATYISPFVGRLTPSDTAGWTLVSKSRRSTRTMGFKHKCLWPRFEIRFTCWMLRWLVRMFVRCPLMSWMSFINILSPTLEWNCS